MTGFGAQTPQLGSTASAFNAQADPILTQGQRLDQLRGSPSTTGRDYAQQGSAYQAALSGPLQQIIRSYGEQCIWVSTNLTDTAQNYDSADASGSAALRSSGSGA